MTCDTEFDIMSITMGDIRQMNFNKLLENALAIFVSFHIWSAIAITIVGMFSNKAALVVCEWTVCGLWGLGK